MGGSIREECICRGGGIHIRGFLRSCNSSIGTVWVKCEDVNSEGRCFGPCSGCSLGLCVAILELLPANVHPERKAQGVGPLPLR